MPVGCREQNELFDKLVFIAGGDMELAKQAIRIAAIGRKAAPLAEVVRIIVNRRPRQHQFKDG